MPEHPDVLIIGGGVIGLTTAYFLVREGISVQIVDQGDFGQEASWAGAGILPPGNPAQARTAYDQLRAHSISLFPSLSAELRERTGLDNGYLRCGGVLGVGDDEATAIQAWRQEGLCFEALDEKALHQLEPALAGINKPYHLPDMAQLRNPRHLKALLAGCERLGIRLCPGCPVHGFERKGVHLTAVTTGMGPLAARRFVLTAGAWTNLLLAHLGWDLGIHPVRGQMALLRTPAPPIHRVVMQGKRYLVPRPDGRVLIGSTEEEVGFDKHTTAEAIVALLSFATSLVPRLAGAHLERSWAGFRPGSPDGMPFLGPVPGLENLYVAAGHFRAGIQLSAATGLVMKELLLGQKTTVPLEPFRLDRPLAPVKWLAFQS